MFFSRSLSCWINEYLIFILFARFFSSLSRISGLELLQCRVYFPQPLFSMIDAFFAFIFKPPRETPDFAPAMIEFQLPSQRQLERDYLSASITVCRCNVCKFTTFYAMVKSSSILSLIGNSRINSIGFVFVFAVASHAFQVDLCNKSNIYEIKWKNHSENNWHNFLNFTHSYWRTNNKRQQ